MLVVLTYLEQLLNLYLCGCLLSANLYTCTIIYACCEVQSLQVRPNKLMYYETLKLAKSGVSSLLGQSHIRIYICICVHANYLTLALIPMAKCFDPCFRTFCITCVLITLLCNVAI